VKKILALSASLLFLPAHASPSCLTKSEARDRWPERHLYWHTADHCWDRHRSWRGRNVDRPYIDRRAYIATAQADEPAQPAQETKSDPWTSFKPIRIIEIIRSSIPVPVTPVEASTLPPLTVPPDTMGTYAVFGGTFLAIFVSFLIWRISYVKRSLTRICNRITATGSKISQVGSRKRDKQSSLPEINIRDLIRRIDRTRHVDNHSEVSDRTTSSTRPSDPTDDSAIACWSRSIRT
jgi:hypothetical protein